MQCPRCGNIKKIIEVNADPEDCIFECRSCWAVFFFDEDKNYYHLFQEKASRMIPILWGIIVLSIAALIIYFFNANFVSIFVGIVLSKLSLDSIKIGLFASNELIDDMCIGNKKINNHINIG